MADLTVVARLDGQQGSLGRWDTTGFNRNDLTQVVTMIHFVAYPNVGNNPGQGVPPTNHWGMFLSFANNRSVRVDTEPNAVTPSGHLAGVVILRSKTYGVTTNAIRTVSAPVSQGVTVQSILRLLMMRRRDQYIFDANYEGCRRWTYTVAHDLSASQFIHTGYTTQAATAILQYWPSPVGSPPVERVLGRGMFFTDEGAYY